MEANTRNLAKQGGCAAIYHIMLALLPIRRVIHMTSLQATLAHLESILSDPHGHLPDDPSDDENQDQTQTQTTKIPQNGVSH